MSDSAIYAARREALMQAIGPRAVAVVSSLPERLRNGDAYHPFRQHSDVYYLTGFVEPETTLILRPGAETDRFVMFVRPRDPEMETWDGKRAGLEGAVARYGANAAHPAAELRTRLGELIANVDEVHYALGIDAVMDGNVTAAIQWLRRMEKKGKRPPRAIVDPRIALHELRLHKQPEELACLRQACAITADAHILAMRTGKPGVFEHEVEAHIDFTFRKRGGDGPGYTSIIGAGDNATILHYTDNRCAIEDGDLVLVDAGCEYGHYTADITRTWPANGTFTAPQRRVYEIVLRVQKTAIEMSKPGATLEQIHDYCVRELTTGMIALGLFAGERERDVDELIKTEAYKKFYPHGTSHWLGLDVHDAGAYTVDGKARLLAPGMVITVEPGLYIPSDADGVPAELRGIGVRIEDDVAITADGCEVLTRACPKEIVDVEAACRA